MLFYGHVEMIRRYNKEALGITFCGTPCSSNGRQKFYSRLALVLQQLQRRLDNGELRAYDIITHSILNDSQSAYAERLARVTMRPGQCLLEHLSLIGDAIKEQQPLTANFWSSICESRISVWLTLQPRPVNEHVEYWPVRSLQLTQHLREFGLSLWTNRVRDISNGQGRAVLRTALFEFMTPFGDIFLFENRHDPGFDAWDAALPLVGYHLGRVSDKHAYPELQALRATPTNANGKQPLRAVPDPVRLFKSVTRASFILCA